MKELRDPGEVNKEIANHYCDIDEEMAAVHEAKTALAAVRKRRDAYIAIRSARKISGCKIAVRNSHELYYETWEVVSASWGLARVKQLLENSDAWHPNCECGSGERLMIELLDRGIYAEFLGEYYARPDGCDLYANETEFWETPAQIEARKKRK